MKQGMSLLSIAMLIAIMAILVSSATVYFVNSSNALTKAKFVTEYSLVQEAVDMYYDTHGTYPVEQELKIIVDTNDTQFDADEDFISNNTLLVGTLNLETLNLNKLEYGKGTIADKDIYVVSKYSGVVYYVKGVVINGTTYFTVTPEIG